MDTATSTHRAGVPVWPVKYFWNTCGVLTADMSYNSFDMWFSVALFASGVLNIAITPWSVCMVDGWCDDAMSTTYRRLYTRMIACSSLMSRISVVYKVRRYMTDYMRREKAYLHKWPPPEPYWRWFWAYASLITVVCLTLIVPLNLTQLYLLYMYETHGSVSLLLFFFNVYLQNCSMCCIETHFAVLCYALYLKFRKINDELSAIRVDVMVNNRYPVALRPSAAVSCRCPWPWSRWRPHDGSELAADKPTAGGGKRNATPTAMGKPTPVAVRSVQCDPSGRPLEAVIGALRTRHALVREAVDQLNDMFGVQLTLSLVALYLMILFDVYNETFYVSGTIGRSKFSYGWMVQYVFRFFLIILTAHYTTQEVTMQPMQGAGLYEPEYFGVFGDSRQGRAKIQ